MTRFNTLNRYRALWTDFEQNWYLRTLAAETEERLHRLEALPGIQPDRIIAEKIALQETRKEIQRLESQLNDL